MTIGERIAQLRKSRSMSQFQLAKTLNIATSTLGMYETNKRKPNMEMLEKLADFFGVSIDYLLGRETSDKSDIDLDKAIDNAMSFDGKPVTEHDRKMMKQLWKAYMAGKE
ncbi:helix-turn-helix domain-containing protein [Limosilactobacillus mucosae]|jgi:transcriptional regulator with XRE-family HTH domain|uniref:helix-turn-helix domain-containing protein n=1 Tax=Limosilactobacillus mucosae TaxID=97478 RepID=UPI000EDEC55B|nr:helix-turn-helix transcriptional regulator [Limosilactobacillus mucosae]HAM87393.1 XRE family transcriptional regulator [Lactobacillus sp.]